jgi:TPR repeat protein
MNYEDMEKNRKAAEQGNPQAQYNVGVLYANGDTDISHRLGVAVGWPLDYKQAAVWFRKAAEQGHPGAQYNLGVLYVQGDGVPQDYKQAAEWYRKAAEQGNSDAQCNLGALYVNGQGVRKNYKQATKWFRKAVEQGHSKAQENLDVLEKNALLQGIITPFMLITGSLGAAISYTNWHSIPWAILHGILGCFYIIYHAIKY